MAIVLVSSLIMLFCYYSVNHHLYTVVGGTGGITAGWDPCEEPWKGVDVILIAYTRGMDFKGINFTALEKSSCKGISSNGSSIIFMQINGLELSGSLRDQLFSVVHVKQMNASPNHIYGEIPASLPPNLAYMDISVNTFTGDLSTSFELFEHQQQPYEQPHQPDEQQQQPDEQQPNEQQQQQQQPDDQQPNDGDQGANDNEVAAVNEADNTWYQIPDRRFNRDGRKESKEARSERHWKKHSQHKKRK